MEESTFKNSRMSYGVLIFEANMVCCTYEIVDFLVIDLILIKLLSATLNINQSLSVCMFGEELTNVCVNVLAIPFVLFPKLLVRNMVKYIL